MKPYNVIRIHYFISATATITLILYMCHLVEALGHFTDLGHIHPLLSIAGPQGYKSGQLNGGHDS